MEEEEENEEEEGEKEGEEEEEEEEEEEMGAEKNVGGSWIVTTERPWSNTTEQLQSTRTLAVYTEQMFWGLEFLYVSSSDTYCN